SVNDTSVPEGNSGTGKATFTVTQLCPNGQTVKVDYLTADGTAQAGTDYQAVFGSLTFAPGETTKTVDVPVLGDVLSEGNETFFPRAGALHKRGQPPGEGPGSNPGRGEHGLDRQHPGARGEFGPAPGGVHGHAVEGEPPADHHRLGPRRRHGDRRQRLR